MKVKCPNCSAVYKADPEKIAEEMRVKCQICNTPFVIKPQLVGQSDFIYTEIDGGNRSKDQDKFEEAPKKTFTLSSLLSWLFGVLFLLGAIGVIIGRQLSSFAAIPYLIIAALLLPPIIKKLPFHLSRGLKAVVIIICLVVPVFLFAPQTPKQITRKPTTSTNSEKKRPASLKTYHMGVMFNVGYTSYGVWQAWWSDKLSENQYIDQKPDASWLFVRLSVRNDDKKPRNIPPFKLIDSTGAEYQTSNEAWRIKENISVIETLNPSVEKTGLIIFDVPRGRTYRLKVSGGYWSGEYALIDIITNR